MSSELNCRTYDGREVANYVLDLCASKGWTVSNLALQKIVYFCHVWTLKKLNRPLIAQQFEAWQHGPVLPYLYREFKDFGERPIQSRAKKLDKSSGTRVLVEYSFDPDTEALLKDTILAYGRLSPFQLVEISHAPGGPWDQLWNHEGEGIRAGMRISNASIETFYSSK